MNSLHEDGDIGHSRESEFTRAGDSYHSNPFLIPPKGSVERLKEWRV